ncbi:formyl transferase [Campylobacter sp. LR264d]|uniref:formyltransferase family protein n=2 Tax=unclassified Campylobacter TaxID=2593542 RepID=UPI001238ABD4|nr:formyltransferase family protein [Campylobacter sp. LR264d]KAA6233429.1 formyl transferase [Campylobacter sp. LR264d]
MNFEKIIILGQGRVAKKCQEIASEFFKTKIDYIESKKENFKYFNKFFNGLKNCFIVSANSFYIFKKECVLNNSIINYHNSLLPKHKGVNAHVFCIFDNDEKSGITWHKVDCNIDTGDILAQGEIILDKQITSLKLLNLQHNLAINTFSKALTNFKNNSCFKQEMGGGWHKFKDIPNDGFLKLSWSKEKISSFLRAMNMGFQRSLPYAKIKLFEKEYEVLFYELNEKSLILHLSDDMKISITKEKTCN